jgi:DNA-binding beta-propeller fold protein YncE
LCYVSSRRLAGLVALLALLAMAASALGVQPRLGPSDSTETLPGVHAAGLATIVRPGQSAPPGELAFLAVEPSGNLLVSDRARHSVMRFDVAGQLLSEWGPRIGDLTIEEPAGVAADRNRVYLVDRGQPRLIGLDPSGGLQGFVDLERYQPYGLNGLAIDSTGNLYVADTGRNRILIFTPQGVFIRQIGQGGSGVGEFTQPMGLAFAPDGSFFVADWENARIEHWDSSLSATDAWTTGVRPYGVAVDPLGRVYVPDPGRTRVQVYSPTGNPLGELGGPGVPIDVSEPRQVAAAPPGTPSVYVLGSDGVVRVDLENVAPPPQAQGPDLISLGAIGLVILVLGLAISARTRRRRSRARSARRKSVEVAPLDWPVGLGAEDGAQR